MKIQPNRTNLPQVPTRSDKPADPSDLHKRSLENPQSNSPQVRKRSVYSTAQPPPLVERTVARPTPSAKQQELAKKIDNLRGALKEAKAKVESCKSSLQQAKENKAKYPKQPPSNTDAEYYKHKAEIAKLDERVKNCAIDYANSALLVDPIQRQLDSNISLLQETEKKQT
jgi:hypothetical protein